MVVGIDGGYVRNWHEKNTNFEVVAGKSLSKVIASKRFGLVQIHDKNPRRRLMSVLSDQGMQANQQMIPNYGEKYRYGETITTAFVESTINEVVAKRRVKKQQMQWIHEGAHYLLQTRTAVLNGDLQNTFERWYSNLNIADSEKEAEVSEMKMAA